MLSHTKKSKVLAPKLAQVKSWQFFKILSCFTPRIRKGVRMTYRQVIIQEHAEILNVQCLEVIKQKKWQSVSEPLYTSRGPKVVHT
jgi:hypothetical protein